MDQALFEEDDIASPKCTPSDKYACAWLHGLSFIKIHGGRWGYFEMAS